MGLVSFSAQASVLIDGKEYQDGCYKMVRGNGTWGIICPTETHQEVAERIKQRRPGKLPGFASSPGSFKPESTPQSAKKCLLMMAEFGYLQGALSHWTHQVLYGDPHERVLTARAAYTVRDMLEAYMRREIGVAERKFRASRRDENALKLCVDHVKGAMAEFSRIFDLVQAEAAKGNRDLAGTGLNQRTSIYNK